MDDCLRRNVWAAGRWRLLVIALVGAMLCFVLQNIAELALDLLATKLGFPGRLDGIKAEQAGRLWVSPLLVAPVLENAICWVWLRVLLPADRWAWWLGPLLVAIIAALFHVALYREIRYFSVAINFFAICCFILNVQDRPAGFWASVLLHGFGNLLVLLSLRTLGF